MAFTINGQSAAGAGVLQASDQITYDDVAAYMDSTRYLDLSGTSRQAQPTLPFARGSYWMEPVRPDVHVTGCDLEYLNEDRVAGCYRPSLFVGMLSAGEHTGFVGGRSIASQRIGVPTLLGVGSEVEITSNQRRGQICRMSGFHIGADFLRGLADDGSAGCTGLVRLLDEGFAFHEIEHSVTLRILLGQLAGNPYSGTLGQIYAESRILSALVELAGLLHDAEDSSILALSRPHRDHAEQARLLLDVRLADPPSVPELARTIGLNETDLRRSFKAAFGTTIIDYLRDRRLEVARVLVLRRELSVASIAYRVGFASPANFATAYRRRFGRPPSQDF